MLSMGHQLLLIWGMASEWAWGPVPLAGTSHEPQSHGQSCGKRRHRLGEVGHFQEGLRRLWEEATFHRGSDEEVRQSWEEDLLLTFARDTASPRGGETRRECGVCRCLGVSSASGTLRGRAHRALAMEGNDRASRGVPEAFSSF